MSSTAIARVIVGLGAVLALAVLAAHPRVKELERRFGVSALMAAGLPFLAIGAVFSLPSVDILTREVLGHLAPAFEFGLGWVGFVVGMQFDLRRLDQLRPGLTAAVAAQAIAPMLTTAAMCAAALTLLGVVAGGGLVRDVIVLTACAAASAPVAAVTVARRYGAEAAALVEELSRLDEIAPLIVLGFVVVLIDPDGGATTWSLPPSAWLLVSLAFGVLLGFVFHLVIRGAGKAHEEVALVIGAIALAAGFSSYLALSVPVACAVAGATAANLPRAGDAGLQRILLDVERPLYVVLLVVVGATWRPDEWQGWLLAVVFVFARVSGKRIGAVLAKKVGPPELPAARDLALALIPQSPIAIVIVASAATAYRGNPPAVVRWAINAVIVGSVLTEILVRVLRRRDRPAGGAGGRAATDVTGALRTPGAPS